MDKYLSEFKSFLNQLNEDEYNEVMNFYTEYLQDGGFDTYDKAVSELGSPKQLARKVLADYSIRLMGSSSSERSSVKRDGNEVRTIWLIILGILSTPLTIPLAIAVLAVLFGFVVTVFALVVSLVAIVLAVFITGVVVLGLGIGVIAQSMSTGLLYIGGGLLTLGAFIMLVPALIWVVRGLINVTARFSRWLYSKLSRKNRAEERRDQK